MEMLISEAFEIIKKVTKASSIQEALSKIYFENEIRWRLKASLDDSEAFDITYGNSGVKSENIENYISEIITRRTLEDFIDYDKLDNFIDEVVDKINTENN